MRWEGKMAEGKKAEGRKREGVGRCLFYLIEFVV
jgi:hypothetical protein